MSSPSLPHLPFSILLTTLLSRTVILDCYAAALNDIVVVREVLVRHHVHDTDSEDAQQRHDYENGDRPGAELGNSADNATWRRAYQAFFNLVLLN